MRRICLLVVMFVSLVPLVSAAGPWGFLVSADGKTRHPLARPRVVVGSGAKAHVVLKGRTIAASHATLTRSDKGAVFVSDLGSRFGTLVAGTQIKRGRKMQLVKKTSITLGAQTWIFEWGERGAIIAPTQAPQKRPVTTKTKPKRSKGTGKRVKKRS